MRTTSLYGAFSLVELSIVLVILGLLVGGVLSGQSLIRAAELRKVKTSVDKYIAATYAFRDKYFCLPGDCVNFASFFPATTNGNGNNDIGGTGDGSTDDNGDTGAEEYSEPLFYWQQLSLAGLIEGNYSGRNSSDAGTNILPGTDAPASGLGSNGFYSIHYQGRVTSVYAYIPLGNYGNVLMPLSVLHNFQGDNVGANLSQQEAWNIDTKYDDGKPMTGSIRAGLGQNYQSSAATYDLTSTDMGVSPIFITGY